MDNEARKAIHWVHRLSAIVVAVVVIALAVRLMKANRLLATTMLVVFGGADCSGHSQRGLGIASDQRHTA